VSRQSPASPLPPLGNRIAASAPRFVKGCRTLMRIAEQVDIISEGSFPGSPVWRRAIDDVEAAIKLVDWPHGSGSFTLNPTPSVNRKGKPDRHANGVLPIKLPIVAELRGRGWATEALPPLPPGELLTTGDLDGLLNVDDEFVGFEWETGNVSSSHRAISKLLDAICRETITGGFLVLPTRETSRYLTDRIGNYEELAPYFRFWARYPVSNGALRIYGVSHDKLDFSVPYIPKGNSGRALA
jgi:hypothetical protein